MKFSCVILAAGDGKRFGSKKQFEKWKGKELWEYSRDAAYAVSDDVVVVGVDIKGGKRRCDSVLNGLRNVRHERVVIIEAARPCVTSGQIKTIGEYTARSISYIMPSVSTIIYDGMVLDRHKTYVLQVPQAFDTSLLISAHECTKNENPTDDTSLMQEVYDISPKLLLGGRNLTKMTVREDMKILEEYL